MPTSLNNIIVDRRSSVSLVNERYPTGEIDSRSVVICSIESYVVPPEHRRQEVLDASPEGLNEANHAPWRSCFVLLWYWHSREDE
jgi:hypothetical protein